MLVDPQTVKEALLNGSGQEFLDRGYLEDFTVREELRRVLGELADSSAAGRMVDLRELVELNLCGAALDLDAGSDRGDGADAAGLRIVKMDTLHCFTA
jgi:hypothetical protein